MERAYIVGTLDTKGEELASTSATCWRRMGVATCVVDVATGDAGRRRQART